MLQRNHVFILSTVIIAVGCGSALEPSTLHPDDQHEAGRPDGGSDSASDGGARAAAAQMNDLSVLYPMGGGEDDHALYIAADEPGRGVAFLPKTIWSEAGGDETSDGREGGPPPVLYNELRVVAFRFDTCFAQPADVADQASCDNQLRLSFQPLIKANGIVTARDSAVHVFYKQSRAELVDAVKSMIALRLANNGEGSLGPLSPHPILVRQGLGGAMASGIRSLLAKYASPSKIVRIARFKSSDPNAAEAWPFKGFDISAAGKGAAMALPALAPNSDGQPNTLVSAATNFGFDGVIIPASTSADNLATLISLPAMEKATAAERVRAYEAGLRIENPRMHSPNTIDCATCHLADPALVTLGERRFGLSRNGNPNAFTPSATRVASDDMRRTATPPELASGQTPNLHMFSYLGTRPGIGQRVINETADVMAYINGVLLR